MNSPHFPNKTPEKNILLQINLSNIENKTGENEKEDFSSQNLKLEIKNLESSLSLYGFPSFSEILIPLSQNSQYSNSVKSTVQNLTKILRIKQKDNEIKVEFLDKINKLETEKQNLENLITKLKNGFNESTEKLKKYEQLFSDKKKKWKEKKQKFLSEIEEVSKQMAKMKLRENQFNHELKKKEILITKLNEQLKKNLFSNEKSSSTSKDYFTNSLIGNYTSSTQKSEITLSYLLTKNSVNVFSNNSNINLNLNNSTNQNTSIIQNPKNIFLEEIHKNLDMKYSNIIRDNEKIKNFLLDFQSKFAELVEIKKTVFLSYYKKTFGIEFRNENNLDLNPDLKFQKTLNFTKLDPSFEIEPFVESFNSNFIKLKEYLLKNEEMFYINNNSEFSEKNFKSILNKNSEKFQNSERDNYLSEKYVENMMNILENYQRLNSNLMIVLNKMIKMKEIEKESSINSITSRFENLNRNFEILKENEINLNQMRYVENINEMLNENNSMLKSYINEKSLEKSEYLGNIENELSKIKENERISIEKYQKFNESTLEDLKAYEKIIHSTSEFCKN